MIAYCIYCTKGIKRLKKIVSKGNTNDLLRVRSGINIITAITKKLVRRSSHNATYRCKAFLSNSHNFMRIAIYSLIKLFLMLIVLCAVIFILDKIILSALGITNRGNEKCICYAKCYYSEDVTNKTSYEMLFGEEEYTKFKSLISLDASEKLELQNIEDAGDILKTHEFIIEHINSDMVLRYKSIVANSDAFRSGDGAKRSQMSNDELREDLVNLLKDVKTSGINLECKVCAHNNSEVIQNKCIGMNHWKAGWSFEDLWQLSDYSQNTGGNGPNNGENSSVYGIQLSNGMWYRWYHQSSEMCANNTVNSSGVRYGTVKMGGNSYGTAANRGCSTYSTSMALSYVLNEDITPFDLWGEVLGEDLEESNGNYWYTTENGAITMTSSEVIVNKAELASKIVNTYSDDGINAVATEFNRETIDETLRKNGAVVFSVRGGSTDWVLRDAGSGSHYIVIIRKEGDLYYVLDSADNHTFSKMNTGIEFEQFDSHKTHSDVIAIWSDIDHYESSSGCGGEHSSDGSWYGNVSTGRGTGTGIKLLSGQSETVGVELYNGLPWDRDSETYFYDIVKASEDVIKFIQDVSGESQPFIDSISTNYTFGKESQINYQELDGVICARIAAPRSLVDKYYCDNFAYDAWRTTGANPSSIVGNSGFTGSKKICAVLEKDGVTYYMPCTAVDGKAHTFPGGAIQTYAHLDAYNAETNKFTLNIGDFVNPPPKMVQWYENELASKMRTDTFDSTDVTIKTYIKRYARSMEIYGVGANQLSSMNEYELNGFVVWQ